MDLCHGASQIHNPHMGGHNSGVNMTSQLKTPVRNRRYV